MSTIVEGDVIRIIQHPGQGFFSCCTIHLQRILEYFNQHHAFPRRVDSTEQFIFYKTPQNWNTDIKHEYFLDQVSTRGNLSEPTLRSGSSLEPEDVSSLSSSSLPIQITNLPQEEQYSDYRYLNFETLAPFLRRYFSPTEMIATLVDDLCEKYNLDCDNTCVLFYRGNDKASEVSLPSYDQYISAARDLLRTQPTLRFLVQSDETEFLDTMKAAFPDNHVIFYDEIRHMPKCMTTVDKTFRYQNAVMSKFYLAITFLMSRCKYVVFGSGNCSLWIALFRGHMRGVTQF